MKSAFRFALFLMPGIVLLATFSTAASSRQDKSSEPASAPIVAIETLRVQSKRLGEERKVEIYVPASYARSKQRYPVIYALDGEGIGMTTANAVRFMSAFAAIPQMPEALVVAVINTDRNRDMPVPQAYGKGVEDNFLAFLADELVPAVDQKYRTQPLRIIGGHSQGGLFATYALAARPAAFQWYLTMDPPLAGFPDAKQLIEKAKAVVSKTQNYRGRMVTVESVYGWKKEWTSFVENAPKSFYGEQVELRDETHETMVYKAIYEGLKRLFHDYAPNIVRDNKNVYTLPALEERYKTLSEAYGYQVDIPKQLLLMSAERNVSMLYGAEAVELINRAVSLYGESPSTRQLMADAQDAVKKGRDPRIAEWAHLPTPDPGEMKPFLGTWENTRNGARWLMTFAVKDGLVQAENTVIPPAGEPLHLEVQFVRVIDGQTLQWGLRNGLGGGTILQTGRLIDEKTLEGKSEPVGIQHAPPPYTFTYKRTG